MTSEHQDFQLMDAAGPALLCLDPHHCPILLQGLFHIHLPIMPGHLGVVRIKSKQCAFPRKGHNVVSPLTSIKGQKPTLLFYSRQGSPWSYVFAVSGERSGASTRFGGFGLKQVFRLGDLTGIEWCNSLGWESGEF